MASADSEREVRVDALVVTHSRVTGRFVSGVLSSRANRVKVAGTAELALRLLAAGAYPLVLVDEILPDLDGRELCARIRALSGGADRFILFLGRRDDFEDMEDALRNGADDWAPHPLDTDTLGRRLAVAEHRVAEMAASRQAQAGNPEQRYRHCVEGGQGFICVHDLDGTVLMVNPAVASTLGYARHEVVGKNLSCFLAPRSRRTLSAYLARIRRKGFDNGLLTVCTRDGREQVWAYQNARHVDPDGSAYVVGHAVDVTALKAAERELRRRAVTDPLTGLANRTLLCDRLDQLTAAAARDGRPFAVLLIDLDRFKRVNDTLGHQAGDEVLKQIATALRRALRACDTVARQGGDEFAALLPATGRDGALTAARKMRAAVRQLSETRGAAWDVDATIGIALFPGDGGDRDGLLHSADRAMYAGKRQYEPIQFAPRPGDLSVAG